MHYLPWFEPPLNTSKSKHAIIIGAGIAGASTAHMLAKKGYKIDLIERHPSPGLGASGNYCGLVSPIFARSDTTLYKFYRQAFLEAIDFYSKANLAHFGFEGLKHYAQNEALLKRYEYFKSNKSDIFSTLHDDFGKYFFVPKGGYIQPFDAVSTLLEHENITAHYEKIMLSFKFSHNTWKIQTNSSTFESENLILCLGDKSMEFLDDFPLEKIRGQTSVLKAFSQDRFPICKGGYITPNIGGFQLIGATYSREDEEILPRSEDDEKNIKSVKAFLPLDAKVCFSKVSFRCASNDRLPILGAYPEVQFYKNAYKALPWKKNKSFLFPKAKYLPNLYISTAHGSRGLVSAILGAKLITSLITGEKIALQKELYEATHPARFLIRRLKRQEKF